MTCEQSAEVQYAQVTATGKRFYTLENEVSCKMKNAIYAIKCLKCKIHYVGETKQMVKSRFLQHRRDVISNKKGTFMVKHFNQPHHSWEDMEIKILDCTDGDDKVKLRTKEYNWIKILTSAFPWGMNDSISGYGNLSEWETNGDMTAKNSPYFKLPVHDGKKRKRGNRKRRNKIVDVEFTDKVKEYYEDKQFDKLYKCFRQASKRTLSRAVKESETMTGCTSIQMLICGYSLGIFDKNKPERKTEYNRKGIVVDIPFICNTLSQIGLQSFMNKPRNKCLLGYQESNSQDFKKPKVLFRLNRTIGSFCFNYNKFLKTIREEWVSGQEEVPCECKIKYSDYISYNGHVITGNVNIITDNVFLKEMMSKGTNHRIDKKFITMEDLQTIRCSIIDYAEKAYIKEQSTDKPQDIANYVDAVTEYVWNKAPFGYERNGGTLKSAIFQDMVCTPVDKATNNFAFICKRLYFEFVNKELSGNSTYIPRNTTVDDLIRRHSSLCRGYGMELEVDNNKVPTLFGIPKFHKPTLKFRFIAGASRSSTKPISIMGHNFLQLIKNHFLKYCKVIENRTKSRRYISVANSEHVVRQLRRLDHWHSAKTYDFSTLYTNLPHDAILACIFELINLCFRNCGKQYCTVRKGRNKYGKPAYYSDISIDNSQWISLDKTTAKQLIFDIINETFIQVGTTIYQQQAGVPMGGNASPLIADLALSMMEFKYLEKHSISTNQGVLTRYIDDILAVNINVSDLIANCYDKSLKINDETGNHSSISYLDIHIDSENQKLLLYNKTKVFNFEVIKAYHQSSCVPASMIIGVIISSLFRYATIISNVNDFCAETLSYFQGLIERGHSKENIMEGLLKFCARHNTKLWRYGMFTKKEIKKKLIKRITERL